MYYNPKRYQSMPVGVVVRKTPGVTKWSKWSWAVSAVLPGAGQAENRILRTKGDSTEYHFSTVNIELHGAETEAYMTGLASKIPSVYVVLREQAGAEIPLEVLLVTASPYEAQDYTDSGEEIVEKVPMPVGLIAWVRDFIENHHVEEAFVKRKRDKKRVDIQQDGIGDPRIEQISDVYRAPSSRKVGFIQ